jgi:hypothetical protein
LAGLNGWVFGARRFCEEVTPFAWLLPIPFGVFSSGAFIEGN